jgi:hypothetical protein
MNIRSGLFPVALGLFATLGGCDALTPELQEEPVTFLVSEQFFRNAEDALSATKAIYGPLRQGGYYATDFIVLTELQTDYLDGRGSYAPAGEFRHDSRNIQRITGTWTSIYRSINRANLVIQKLPDIQMDEELKKQYIAEARFVRALGYYNLVRLWGPVPLRIEPVTGLGELPTPRAPVEEVYGQIIQDAQFAEANLPDRYSSDNIGRATRWAAKMLLADVHLTRKEWAQAAAKAKEVIDSGRFSLVRVRQADDFQQVFGPTLVETPEEILAAKFATGSGPQTSLVNFSNHQSAGYSRVGYRTVLGDLESEVLAGWDPRDLRYQYNRYSASERDRKFLSAAEPELFKKYRDPSGNGGTDIPIYRYPEALLIFAEAQAMASGGPTPAAYEAVNRVRRRAYGLDPNTPSSVDLAGLGLAEFRAAVLAERAREFILEAKRWFDLVRTGQALPRLQAVGEPIAEKNLLWPLPVEELTTNPALSSADQNAGW